jgi:hypothetical protein
MNWKVATVLPDQFAQNVNVCNDTVHCAGVIVRKDVFHNNF